MIHDDVIKWKYFPRNWPFVRGIHRSPVNSPHKGQWREVLMFSLTCVWINDWVNNREAGDLRRQRAHYDVIVMWTSNGIDILGSTLTIFAFASSLNLLAYNFLFSRLSISIRMSCTNYTINDDFTFLWEKNPLDTFSAKIYLGFQQIQCIYG